MEKNRPKVGILVYVIRDGKVLLGKRKGLVGDGMWGLPGGHLEFGESWTDSAKRELLEETGLVAESMHLLNIVNDPLPADNSHYIHVSFLADDILGEPSVTEPDKCSEWKWFTFDNLPVNIFIGHRASFDAFKNKRTVLDAGTSLEYTLR